MDAEWIAAIERARAASASRGDATGFAAHVAACRARGTRIEHVAELLTAWAAGRGEPAAVQALDAQIAAEVAPAARRLDRNPAFVDELHQAVRVRLLVANAAGRVLIDDYSGRGPLRGWLGVVALRAGLNLKRRDRPVATQDVVAELIAAEDDVELQHLKTLYRAEFREALAAALAALPERERALLRLAYVDGLKIVQIGRLYGVHETTAARWIARAAAQVGGDARGRLIARLQVSPSSLDSVARMVLSNLELSIARFLGA